MALASAAGLLQRGVAMIGTFIMFPRVLGALGTADFGIWGAAISLSNLVLIADFGVGSAILTLVAHAFASEEADRPREYFTAALILACAIAVVVGSVGALAVISLVPTSQTTVYLIAVAGVAINVPLGSAQSAWLALQRGWMAAFWDLIQTVFLISGLVLSVLCTKDVLIYVAAAYAALLLANALNMTFLLVSHPELRPTRWIDSLARVKDVLSVGTRYFVLTALDALSYVFDNVLALQLLGTAASARMAIVQRVCLAAMGLLVVIAQPLWPAFVDAAARGDRTWMFRALARGSLLVASAALGGSCVIVLFGRELLLFWLKADIGIGQPLLWTMAIWILSLSLVRVQILFLNALRVMNFQIVVFAIATLIALPLKFLLAPYFGVSGLLISTAVTFPVIIIPAILWRVGQLRMTLPSAAPPSTGEQLS